MDRDTLRRALEEVLAEAERSHVERLAIVAAIVSEGLRTEGLEATLVGGSAIEFYDPGAYTTTDIDLVIEQKGPTRNLAETLAEVFGSLGFSRRGRHWVCGQWFVEVPGTSMTDPTETFSVGPYRLRVVRKEILEAELRKLDSGRKEQGKG